MITKNKSHFTVSCVTVSRRDYDLALSKDKTFLQYLFVTYTRSWSLAGISFYSLNSDDFVRLFKLLA